jgi:hypothetical protein
VSFAKGKLYVNTQTNHRAIAVEPSLITREHYWMQDYDSEAHFELESNDWNNWVLDIEHPVNSVDFTIGSLNILHKFIHSDLVTNLKYFCEYDKQAIEDALYYLQEHEKLVKLMERAKKMAFRAYEDDEEEDNKVRFKMDADGNLTRIVD